MLKILLLLAQLVKPNFVPNQPQQNTPPKPGKFDPRTYYPNDPRTRPTVEAPLEVNDETIWTMKTKHKNPSC